MRYTPFDKDFNDILPSDLEGLREVHEGWYVEYKSQLPTPRTIAKTLSSFANQYGGWLFLGVKENSTTSAAGDFPGIENMKLPQVLESIRNAAKDIVRPHVEFQHRTFQGPIDVIGLASDHCIVAVHVPEGPDTPYVHNDGKIYIRVGDSSSPTPATDRATFDLLYRRGEEKRSFLKSLIERSPLVSQGEENQPFVHLSILTDPYGVSGLRYKGTFSDFSGDMMSGLLPFDNIFSAPHGFTARQTTGNNFSNRLFTWEFSRNGNSFVTIPLQLLSLGQPANSYNSNTLSHPWSGFSNFGEFLQIASQSNLSNLRVLNMNIVVTLLMSIVRRHHTILRSSELRGPFFMKARIENVWRSIPFIDLPEYIEHVKAFGLPIVQDDGFLVPPGSTLNSFIEAPEISEVPGEIESFEYVGSSAMLFHLMAALGLPGEWLAEIIKKLVDVALREIKK